ncbi:fibronectin type III domain-containing protein [Aureisphaera sp. CAU 1614]|uniref:Fibronectin type III domain-containing protein n=1 Tax=Halomarinibacterium sedimenti TaxID=2857106 RepID=A0A9X1FQ89_9FLAO|nr:fibronectin type III domain-containing protein [Halomarinibacterium sedimenti]MBW2938482.1 fibronectin type III domain-containing protein [Halomarinibacterium sedimenti]
MNLIKSIVVIIITIAFFSCSNDDKTSTQTNLPPGDFTLSVEDIATFSARVTWTESQNNSDSPLTYKVYLNDELLGEEITDNEFLITELESVTNYSVKVEAVNDYGTKNETTTFETLEIPELYFFKFYNPNNPCFYDEVNYLPNKKTDSIKRFSLCTPPYYDNIKYKFSYDNDGKIIKVHGTSNTWGTAIENYSYSGINVSKIDSYYGWGADGSVVDTITYTPNFTEYEYRRYHYGLSSYYLFETTQNYILNGPDDKLIQHRKNITYSYLGEVGEIIYDFEYENGNLIRISDSNGDFWDIEYDNAPSFITFSMSFASSWLPDHAITKVAGLYQHNDENLINDLNKIPEMFNHFNTNNPRIYRKNGTIIREIQYEYNIFGYPSKVMIEGIDDIHIDYIEL